MVSAVNKANGQWTLQLAAAGFVHDSTLQASPEHVQFCFAHGPLQAQQQTIIEVRWVVHTVFIENERVGQSADL
jgi:hypothetical protein